MIETYDYTFLEPGGKHYTTPFSELLYIVPSRLLYMKPAPVWKEWYVNDDYGNLVQVSMQGAMHYKRQGD